MQPSCSEYNIVEVSYPQPWEWEIEKLGCSIGNAIQVRGIHREGAQGCLCARHSMLSDSLTR